MPRFSLALLALATLSAAAAPSIAQSSDSAGATPSSSYTQPQPAPIERAYPSPQSSAQNAPQDPYGPPPMRRMRRARQPEVTNAQVAPGIFLRTNGHSSVQTVSAKGEVVELRVQHGVANVSVRHPDNRPQILVDLPGGQAAILKDGFYTFNADTNTVRTLKGEAAAFAAAKPDGKPVKVKEDHALTFSGPQLRSVEFEPASAASDVLPAGHRGEGDYAASPGNYGPYGDGFYGGGPYYGWGYPYGWGGPFGWGYPYGYGYPFGFGIGFGYFGGFRGGFRR